jgi:glyoxylase-like metal-dependent hydrolase (beta-lactamase superfamily II)
MKRFAVLSVIVAVGLGTALYAQGLPGPEPIEKIGDNLYKIFGGGGNTTVFVRDDGVVLIDTKLPNMGEGILAEVRKITDKPVTMVINTHSHPDHLGSNPFFRQANATIDIVMHANAAESASSGPFANPQGAANVTFTDRKTLGSGRNQLDLYYFGPAHTNGDAFIVIPSEKALMMGDVMAWDMGPLIDPGSGGSMVATPVTVGKVVGTIKGVEKVIEGHGHVNSWEGLLRYYAYTQKVVEVAQKAIDEGLNYLEAYSAYFATDPAMAPYTGDELKKGLEYGSSPKTRSLNNIYVAMGELKGEPAPLTMGAPPPPQ